ncbi:hypothetical protein ACFVFN_35865, partial [Streptomyces pharetrae]
MLRPRDLPRAVPSVARRGPLRHVRTQTVPHLRPPLPARTPLASRGLLAAVVAGLGLAALSDLFSVVAGIRLRNLAQKGSGFFSTDQQKLEDAAELYEKAGMFQGTAYLACAVVFLGWFFRMRRTTGLMAPDQFRR